MARLVSVCRSPEHTYDRRQMPLQVEDNLTMVLQFTDTCLGCDVVSVKRSDLESFAYKFNLLTDEDISLALMATRRELLEHLAAAAVPCVGCRKSMERLYEQLMESGHATIDPLVVTKNGVLSVCRNYLFDAKAAYALFYVHGGKLAEVLGTLPKNKKNRRCQLHSLDMQKCKFTGNWFDVWELMSNDCKDELLLVDFDTLADALEDYLVKHRFCGECKTKVQRAYTLLTGDGEVVAAAKKEKGYCAALYDGLKCCRQEKHLHVSCNADLVGRLIVRAEPDLIGSRRERHAKTMDVAQEEVLACLGSLLHERFGRVHQKLRLAEQTWRQLFYVGVDCLKKNFEVAVERKQGVSNLERVCEEMALADKKEAQKREQKRQKKKDKKRAASSKRADAAGGACADESTSVATFESRPLALGSTVSQSDDDHGSCGSCVGEPVAGRCDSTSTRAPTRATDMLPPPDGSGSQSAAAADGAAAACSELSSLSEASCCGDSWPEDEPPPGCSVLSGGGIEAGRSATVLCGAASAAAPAVAGIAPSSPGYPATSAKASLASDPGYSSGADGSDSCACSEAACGEDDLCPGCEDHRSFRAATGVCFESRCSRAMNRFPGPTLQEMLEQSSSVTSPSEGAEGGCDAIPDDEVAAFRAQKPTVTADRLALRKTLRQRFEELVRQPPAAAAASPRRPEPLLQQQQAASLLVQASAAEAAAALELSTSSGLEP